MDGFRLMGMEIRQSPLAVTRRKKTAIVRHPVRKRRRNWAVQVSWIETPCAYKLGNDVLICHPSLYEKIKKEFQP